MLSLRTPKQFLIGSAVSLLALATFGVWVPWLNDRWASFAESYIIPAIPVLLDRLLGG